MADCHVHAYVLMYFNRAYDRTGTLWEGRFRSSIVDSDTYLLTCYRYIEANPVRAGMVAGAGDYPWSSHAANAHGVRDDIVTPHPGYLAIAPLEQGLEAYRQLFAKPEDPAEVSAIRLAVNGGFALGSSAFLLLLEQQMGQRVERMTKGRVRASLVSGVSDDDNSGLSPVV